MDQLYGDSGLFTELGELMAHDQVFYEDIPKQQTFYSSYVDDGQQIQPLDTSCQPSSGDNELDILLAEGNQMLDRIMAENGLDLLSTPVDLADVDELINSTYTQLNQANNSPEPSSWYGLVQQVASPTSSISTLPSEPSSPVDLFPVERRVSGEVEPPLTDLLESLLAEPEDQVNYSNYDYEVASPASSYHSSETSYSQEDTSSFINQSWEDSSSTYSQSIYSPAPSISPAPVQSSGKVSKSKKKSKSIPYSKLPAGRKERKKQQNKEAAIRYREKKRSEAMLSQGEEQILTDRNKELKTEVLNLEREIMCMKELLSDVFNIHSI